jgi:hypothetical protein
MTSASGVTLEPGFEFLFSTRAAAVIRTVPAINAANVPLTITLQVAFDRPMDRASVENDFLLIDNLSGRYLSGQFQWNADQTEFNFAPDERFQPRRRGR